MELKDFIETIILDVGSAIEKVRIETGDNYIIGSRDGSRGTYGGTLSFDIAVTQNSEEAISGKSGVAVLGIGAQVNGELKEFGQNVSRIKFDLSLNNSLTTEDVKGLSEHDKWKYTLAREKIKN